MLVSGQIQAKMPTKRIKFEAKKQYHIYNRGFCKRYIFKDKHANGKFLDLAVHYSKKFDITIESFSILPNHFHFLVIQNGKEDAQKFIRGVQLCYAKYFNKKHRRKGPVFDGRYNAVLVDSRKYFFNIHNYIFNNPKKHKKFIT